MIFKAPFLTSKQIEDSAEQLLADYKCRYGGFGLVAPVDEIAEIFLGLEVSFVDFPSLQTLGCLKVREGKVMISSLLDPTGDYQLHELGRYRFTLGHEIGHAILHRPIAEACFVDNEHAENFTNLDMSDDQHNLVEAQANRFSAALLMPAKQVQEEFKAIFGHDSFEINTWGFGLRRTRARELRSLNSSFVPTNESAVRAFMSCQLSDRFAVSREAMFFRLKSLGILYEDPVCAKELAWD